MAQESQIFCLPAGPERSMTAAPLGPSSGVRSRATTSRLYTQRIPPRHSLTVPSSSSGPVGRCPPGARGRSRPARLRVLSRTAGRTVMT